MLVIVIESLISIVLFTAVIVSLTLKNPLTSVGDYLFHIRQSCIGMLPGLPACLLTGLFVMML